MAETAIDLAKRAAECARLANLTTDPTLQTELLRLRQTYLTRAVSLGLSLPEAIALGSDPAKET